MIAANQAELHGDTIEQARLGNRLNKNSARTEKGDVVNGVGDMPNQHDILTGSTPDGRAYTDAADHTCSNWTSNAHVEAPARGAAPPATPPAPGPSAQLGHHDKTGGGNGSWNSTHGSRGCSQPNLVSTGGAGMSVLLRSELELSFVRVKGRGLNRGPGPFFWSLVAWFVVLGPPCACERAVPETDTAGPGAWGGTGRNPLSANHFPASHAPAHDLMVQ